MNLRERLEQLEPRERKLLGILGAVFVGFFVLLVPVLVSAMVSSQREENEQLRAAIDAIHDSRDRIAAREAEKQKTDARYARPAPPLASFLEKFAQELGIEIPESQDRPVVPHGKRYEERSTKVVLNRIGMLSLVNFMERIENSGHPVRLSLLNIKKRPTDPDSYDVNLVVSAFDRKEPEKPKSAGAQDNADDEAASDTEP